MTQWIFANKTAEASARSVYKGNQTHNGLVAIS